MSERRPGPSTKQLVGGLQSLMELTTLGRGCYAQRVRDEWIRHLRFPESRPARWPTRWVPLLEVIVLRRRRPSGNEAEWQDDRGRARRQAADHVAQIMVAAWMGLFSWRRLWSDEQLILRDALKGTGEEGSVGTGSRVGRRQSIRVAYVGPTPRKGAEACRAAHGLSLKSSLGPEFGWTSISPSRKIGRRSLLSGCCQERR